MAMHLIHVRHNKGEIDNISVDNQSTVEQLKLTVSSKIKIQPQSFQMYWKGKILNENLSKITLESLGIESNQIIDVTDKVTSENQINLTVDYGSDRASLHAFKQQTVRSIKNRIANIFNLTPHNFDLVFMENTLNQENRTISDFNIQNGNNVGVKLKIPSEGWIGSKLRMVESVASSSGDAQQKDRECSPLHEKKGFHVNKKISCSASLQNIKQHQQYHNSGMKSSSIQPYIMHKNQIDQIQERQKKITKIEDIKQTMSFGSLQQVKCEDIEVQVYSEDQNKYYKFVCPYGCKIIQLRDGLAKAQRQIVQKIQFIQIKDVEQVEMLSQNGQPIQLKYRIINSVM